MYENVSVISPRKAAALHYEIIRYHQETKYWYPTFDVNEGWKLAIERFVKGLPLSPLDPLEGIKDWFKDRLNDLKKTIIDPIKDAIGAIFDPILDTFGSIYEGIKSGISAIIDPIWESIQGSFSGFTTFLDSIWTGIMELPNTISAYIGEFGATLQTWVASAIQTALDGLNWVWEGLTSGVEYIKGQIEQIWNTMLNHLGALGNAIGEAFAGVGKFVSDGLASLGKWITDGLQTLWNGIVSGFQGVVNGIQDAWNGVMEGINSLAASLAEIGGFSHSSYDYKEAYDTIWFLMKVGVPLAVSGQISVTVLDALQLLSNMHIKDTYQYVLEITGVRAWMQTVWNTEWQVNTAIPQRLRLLYTIMPNPMPLRDAMLMRSRYIIDDKDLVRSLRFEGINPTTELEAPTLWYDERSILENPLDSTKWKPTTTEDYKDAYVRQAGAPAGYFLLAMASRSGFFDEKLFMQALLDSNYGPLAMGIAINAFKRNFLLRWIHKYEDEAVNDYIQAEIDETEFRARLDGIGYGKSVIDMYVDFFTDRRGLRRRKATMALLQAAYQAGRIDMEEFKKRLIAIGYKADIVELIIAETEADIAPDKELTKAEVLRLYKAKSLTKDQARIRLNRIYADEEDTELIMSLYEPGAKEVA